jgi:hypothetical protein
MALNSIDRIKAIARFAEMLEVSRLRFANHVADISNGDEDIEAALSGYVPSVLAAFDAQAAEIKADLAEIVPTREEKEAFADQELAKVQPADVVLEIESIK